MLLPQGHIAINRQDKPLLVLPLRRAIKIGNTCSDDVIVPATSRRSDRLQLLACRNQTKNSGDALIPAQPLYYRGLVITMRLQGLSGIYLLLCMTFWVGLFAAGGSWMAQKLDAPPQVSNSSLTPIAPQHAAQPDRPKSTPLRDFEAVWAAYQPLRGKGTFYLRETHHLIRFTTALQNYGDQQMFVVKLLLGTGRLAEASHTAAAQLLHLLNASEVAPPVRRQIGRQRLRILRLLESYQHAR